MKISDLKPAPYNPRKIDTEALAGLSRSLAEFGDISGLVWNRRTGHLVCGHQRLRALQDAHNGGLTMDGDCVVTPTGERFPVRTVDWDDERERIANVAANNPHIAGLFDQPKLDGLLADLDTSELFRPLRLDLLKGFAPQEGLTDPDEVPDSPAEPVTNPGDMWACGEHRLLCGNATNAEDVRRLMDGRRAAIVFTDPPYGVGIGAKNRLLNSVHKAGRCLSDIKDDTMTPGELHGKLLAAFKIIPAEVAAEDCTVFVTAPQGGELGMMMMMMREAGMPVRHVLIWKKNQPTFSLGRLDYDYAHEPILLTWGKRHKRPMRGQHRTSVWEIDRPRASPDHATAKPAALYENAYLNNSNAGDIAADVYLGSGTAILAAERTGRLCCGLEIEPRYVDVAVRRWEQFTGRKAELLK